MASALRRYSATLSTTTATTLVTVPAAKALVAKILVAATGSSTVTLTVGGAVIMSNMPLSAGQVYSETGLVAVAAETIVATAGTANVLTVSVFGEEVDN